MKDVALVLGVSQTFFVIPVALGRFRDDFALHGKMLPSPPATGVRVETPDEVGLRVRAQGEHARAWRRFRRGGRVLCLRSNSHWAGRKADRSFRQSGRSRVHLRHRPSGCNHGLPALPCAAPSRGRSSRDRCIARCRLAWCGPGAATPKWRSVACTPSTALFWVNGCLAISAGFRVQVRASHTPEKTAGR